MVEKHCHSTLPSKIIHLEEAADLGQILFWTQKTKSQDGTDMLRYGVEVRDEAIWNLPWEENQKTTDVINALIF